MRRSNKNNRHPFIIAIGVSTLVLAFIGIMGKNGLYSSYDVDLAKAPQLSVVFQGIKDAKYPWDIFKKEDPSTSDVENELADTHDNSEVATTKDSTSLDNDLVNNTSDNTVNTTEKVVDTNTDTDTKVDTQKAGILNNGGLSSETKINNTAIKNGTNTIKTNLNKNSTVNKDKTTSKEFETVEKSYFKDALFIGDSRTIGLQDYSGWSEPTYYASTGISIWQIFDKAIADVNGKKMTIDKALQQKKFGKIYIMLGINELGTGTAKTFSKEYQSVIEKIQKLQPDAIIYIQSIMNVSKKKSNSDRIFNNANIKERNNAIAKIADNKTVFYIDVNKAFVDSSGAIPANYTFDGIHLKAAYYKVWTEFLLKNAIKK